jgi:flagellar motor switch/type III secretory pathway protein FliN
VVLASPFEEAGVRATLGDDGRLVLGGELQDLGWLGEVNVADTDDTGRDALIDAVGEVPVVVRVEIGLAEMRAREWAALGPGDVIALGSRIGEPVTLRVGGAAVARGELVDLDGEMGVRILGRGGA